MIISTNELNKNGMTREDIVEAFCENLMNKISEANANGKRNICFDASVYRQKSTGKVVGVLPDNWLKTHDWEVMPMCYRFDNYKDEVAEKFIKAGYKIKPTGYIGGVWQLTEDIMW